MPETTDSPEPSSTGTTSAATGVLGSAALMGVLTLLSRVLGLVRDQVIAWLLGTGVQADAYGVAIKLPNLFRRLMGEGAMSAAYVPVLSGLLEKAGERPSARRQVWIFVTRFALLLSLALLVVTLAGVVFSPLVVRLVAPGFDTAGTAESAAAYQVTVALNRIVFPYLFFVCLAALAMGTLNALGSFGPPAFTPVLLNLSIIGCALTLHRVVPLPVYALGIGYLVGGVLQLAWQVPFLRRRGARLVPSSPRLDGPVVQVGRRMGVGAFGAGIYQVNVLVGTMVASSLPRGSIASLYFADRVNELVLGVWAVSVATVVLPSLSRLITAGDESGVENMLCLSLRQVMFVTLPAAVGLACLARPIIRVLFLRGEFGDRSLTMTAGALVAYSVGLPAIGGARVMVSAFYARGDVARAVALAAVSFAANLGFLALFYLPLAHRGVALAGSGAAWTSWVGLMLVYRWRHGGFHGPALCLSALRSTAAALVMAAGLVALTRAMPPPAGFLAAAGWLLVAVAGGSVVYLGTARVLGAREPREFLSLLSRRRG